MMPSFLRGRLSRPILALGAAFLLTALAWSILYLNPPEQHLFPNTGTEIGMKRFLPSDSGRTFPQVVFQNAQGQELSLEAFRGQVILVNLWASWCPPCKEEMPTLARLQTMQGGEDFQVVTIAVEDIDSDELRTALDQLGASNLPGYQDPSGRIVGAFGAIGLPTSLLLNRLGGEIGRLPGPAKWDSPPALKLIEDARAGVFENEKAKNS